MTTICPHCGQETDSGLPFCQLCGQRLTSGDAQGVGLPSWLRPSSPSQPPAPPVGVKPQLVARLTVVAPTVLHQTQGREFPLDGHELRVGRAPSCDINLDGDPLVSRFHASLRLTDGGYVISDLNSSNGTEVNGQEIHADTLLHEGDELTIGECKMRIETGFFEINTAHVAPQVTPEQAPMGLELPAISASDYPTAQPALDGMNGAHALNGENGASAPDPFPPLFDSATGPMPVAAVEPAAPPPPPAPPTPEELREQATSLSVQLAQQAREAIQEAERLRAALEDARQRVATAQGLQPAAGSVTYRGDLPALRDLVGQVVEIPQHLELVTRLASVAPQLAEALDTLNATEPYAALLGALADLREKLDSALT